MSYTIGQGDGESCDESWLFQRVGTQVEMHRVGNGYELFLHLHLFSAIPLRMSNRKWAVHEDIFMFLWGVWTISGSLL